ncbi:MAG: T9SS type A sorting domain-containing protein [Bacteroidota bacterium]
MVRLSGLQPSVHKRYEVYDLSGRLLDEQEVRKNIHYQDVPEGMVIVKVIGNQFSKSFKVLSR